MLYRHKKGGLYLRLCEARHTETGELLTVYIGITGPWCRPSGMFTDGRFAKISVFTWFYWIYKYSYARILEYVPGGKKR